jgi:hypothetical protein
MFYGASALPARTSSKIAAASLFPSIFLDLKIQLVYPTPDMACVGEQSTGTSRYSQENSYCHSEQDTPNKLSTRCFQVIGNVLMETTRKMEKYS